MEEKLIPIRLRGLADLVRLAASIAAQQFAPYMIKFRHRDKTYLGIVGVLRDYYKYYGLPVFYYCEVDGREASVADESNYIVAYTGEERYEFAKTPKPGISIPLIGLASKPPFIPDDI
ncbi:MAG: hypothetical protein ABWK00_06935 [Desulfurococcaceae archaeon]